MPIGTIPVPPPHIEDKPTVSVCINREWANVLIGQIWTLRYPEAWGGDLFENRRARGEIRNLINMLMSDESCGDMNNCCVAVAVTLRIDPISGNVQQSSDNGATWLPAAGGFQSVIVQPAPPVTSGVSATKCDAAINCAHQVDLWVAQVATDFDTATTLLEFCLAVLEAIAIAVLAILSAGALTPLEALVLPTIGAAAGAAFGAGKAVFEAYFTDANKKIIKCSFVHNIGDDGSFSDAQFSAAWNEMNTALPASPAKMLLMGFFSSVGKSGLNAMAASGYSTGGNCSECSDECTTVWTFYGVTDVVKIDNNHYQMTRVSGHFAFTSGNYLDGCYFDGYNSSTGQSTVAPVGSTVNVTPTNPKVTPIWNYDSIQPPENSGTFIATFSKNPIV